MVIAIIVLSIILFISAVFGIFVSREYSTTLNAMRNMLKDIEEEYSFAPIPEVEILNKFEDVNVLYYIQPYTDENDIFRIVDLSQYEKNNLISLTYFVQEQDYKKIQQSIRSPQIKEKIKRKVLEETGELVDDDYLQEIMNSINTDFLIAQHCTVYQLCDGRWIVMVNENE